MQSNLGDSQGWFGCRSYGSNSYLEDKPVKQMGYPKNDGFDDFKRSLINTLKMDDITDEEWKNDMFCFIFGCSVSISPMCPPRLEWTQTYF